MQVHFGQVAALAPLAAAAFQGAGVHVSQILRVTQEPGGNPFAGLHACPVPPQASGNGTEGRLARVL